MEPSTEPGWAVGIVSWLGWVFAPLCHQLPARSPYFAGVAFPMCFRVAGLYFGVLASYAYLAATGGWRRRMPDARTAIGITLAMGPFLVDGWSNTVHLWSSPDPVRALSGVGFGIVLPLLLVPLGSKDPYGGTRASKATVARARAVAWPALIASGLTALLFRPGSLAGFAALAVAAAAGLGLLLGNLALAARPGMWDCAPATGVPHA